MSRFPYVAALFSVLSGALLVVLWWIGFRWAALLGLVWFAVLGFALLRLFKVPVEKLLVYTMVLSNSIRMDVHIDYSQGAFGFPINNGEVCLVGALVLWLIRAARDPRPIEWPRRYVVPLALLLLGAVIAVVQTPDWPTRCRMVLYVIESALTVFYLWNLDFDETDYRRLCIGVAIALGLQGVLGSLQAVTHSSLGLQFFGASNAAVNTNSFSGFSRVGGTLGQPNRFALFMNTGIFVPLAMMLTSRTLRGRILSGLVFMTAFGALIMSQSRGAWGGFACAFVPFAYLVLRDRLSRFHSVFALGWILCAGVIFILVFPPTYARLTAPDSDSASIRIPMALTALQMIRHNPFGVGFSNYVARMNEYDVTPDGLTYHFRFPVHDAYLILAAEQGVWVLLVFIGFLIVYYRDVLKLVAGPPSFVRTIGLAFAAGMVAAHIHMNVEISHLMTNAEQWFAMGMVLNAVHYVERRREAERALPRPVDALDVSDGRAREVVPAAS